MLPQDESTVRGLARRHKEARTYTFPLPLLTTETVLAADLLMDRSQDSLSIMRLEVARELHGSDGSRDGPCICIYQRWRIPDERMDDSFQYYRVTAELIDKMLIDGLLEETHAGGRPGDPQRWKLSPLGRIFVEQNTESSNAIFKPQLEFGASLVLRHGATPPLPENTFFLGAEDVAPALFLLLGNPRMGNSWATSILCRTSGTFFIEVSDHHDGDSGGYRADHSQYEVSKTLFEHLCSEGLIQGEVRPGYISNTVFLITTKGQERFEEYREHKNKEQKIRSGPVHPVS